MNGEFCFYPSDSFKLSSELGSVFEPVFGLEGARFQDKIIQFGRNVGNIGQRLFTPHSAEQRFLSVFGLYRFGERRHERHTVFIQVTVHYDSKRV